MKIMLLFDIYLVLKTANKRNVAPKIINICKTRLEVVKSQKELKQWKAYKFSEREAIINNTARLPKKKKNFLC